MRDIFVKKEKLLESKYVEILDRNINVRKDIEHGTKKELSGKEVDQLLEDADKYLKRIKRLFSEIEKIKEKEDVVQVYENSITAIRDVLRIEGISKAADSEIVTVFEDELISTLLKSNNIEDTITSFATLLSMIKQNFLNSMFSFDLREYLLKRLTSLLLFLILSII